MSYASNFCVINANIYKPHVLCFPLALGVFMVVLGGVFCALVFFYSALVSVEAMQLGAYASLCHSLPYLPIRTRSTYEIWGFFNLSKYP